MRITTSTTFSLIGLTAIAFAFTVTSQAQIIINLPKFPKIKKEKPQPSPTTAATTERPSEPTVTAAAGSTATPRNTAGSCTDSTLRSHLNDLAKTRAEAEEFTPGLRDYFVSTISDRKNIYLEAALFPAYRTEWLKHWPADFVACLNPELDALGETAKKKLPGYFGPSGYTYGTPAEKKTLQGARDDLSTAKVLRSGLKQASWLIDKNSYGLPTSRYKHGYLLVQYPGGMHGGFCWVYRVNLVQDYSGGGTYGASYGYYISRAVAGCPKA